MKDYFDTCGTDYEPVSRVGFTSIPVLPFLVGSSWNEVALGYVHGLRPSTIRVITCEETTDAQLWRVSVYVDENDVITAISQEVEVGLPDGVVHGQALRDALYHGIEVAKWHQDAESYVETGEGLFKVVGDQFIPFPETGKHIVRKG